MTKAADVTVLFQYTVWFLFQSIAYASYYGVGLLLVQSMPPSENYMPPITEYASSRGV